MSDLFIINDETPDEILFPADKWRGRENFERPNPTLCSGTLGSFAVPFDDRFLLPKSTRMDLTRYREARGMANWQRLIAADCPTFNQGQTKFCWAVAPAAAASYQRVLDGQLYRELSGASVACRINGFQNEGGWGLTAMKFAAENGFVPADIWPNNVIDRKLGTAENYSLARKYRVGKMCELEPRNHDQLCSMLLHGHLAPIGMNWWRHEIVAIDPWIQDGEECILGRNQWGRWGMTLTFNGKSMDGFVVLQGSKKFADDAVSLMSMTAAA